MTPGAIHWITSSHKSRMITRVITLWREHVTSLITCVTTIRFLIEWMDDLRFHVLFNSISVISGRWADDNERLCAMEHRLRLRIFNLERGQNPGPLAQ